MDGSWSSPMDGSWSSPTPSTAAGAKKSNQQHLRSHQPESKEERTAVEEEEKYYALIVDSGAIIKHSGFSTLHNSASKYYTTQGVIDEIRDSKARHHLESLPFELNVREPTSDGVARVVEFSKKTGDYAGLSIVDLQVLGLLYDLEKEGCGDMEHIRIEPKRMVGNGKFINLSKKKGDDASAATVASADTQSVRSAIHTPLGTSASSSFFESSHQTKQTEEKVREEDDDDVVAEIKNPQPQSSKPKSWAMLVNPSLASSPTTTNTATVKVNIADAAISTAFGSMNLNSARGLLETMHEEKNNEDNNSTGGGQFSDAEDDDSFIVPQKENKVDVDVHEDESSDDGEEFASIGDDFSDEECDIYILDPEEVEEKRRLKNQNPKSTCTPDGASANFTKVTEEQDIVNELNMEFPSLAAASTVPYEGSDDEDEKKCEKLSKDDQIEKLRKAAEEEAQRKEESLKPLSKSGKVYNTLGKYKSLASEKGINIKGKAAMKEEEKIQFSFAKPLDEQPKSFTNEKKTNIMQSRINVGAAMSGQSAEVDDDGEGWVTSAKEIVAMKATGTLDPFRSDHNQNKTLRPQENLPMKHCRSACATTDFAMQNVILQMNLELLTVDGVRVRKLKSWVQRCSTCSEVYTAIDSARMFCAKCGSSCIQRVAASVDGKTGRLKLHLKKNYQHRLRGAYQNLGHKIGSWAIWY